MAIELRLEKNGGDPWGFKITGGADLEIPLTVVKISDGGPAHKAGLQIGDVILRVNESDLSDLPHSEAQHTIGNSGEILVLIIYRGELTEHQSALIADEQNNEEVHQIMEGSIPVDYPERSYVEEQMSQQSVVEHGEIKHDLNLTDEEIRSIIHPETLKTNKSTSQIGQLSSAQIEIQKQQESRAEMIYESSQQSSVQVEHEEMVDEKCIDSVRQNSIIEGSNLLVKHEEIENIAGKIVEQMSKIQQKQEEHVEEIAEKNQEAIIWQSQVNVEQKQILKESEVEQKQIFQLNNAAGQMVEEVSHTGEMNEDAVIWQSQVKLEQDPEVLKNAAVKIVEEVTKTAEMNQEAVIWQSQVKLEKKEIVQQSEVLKAVSGYLSEMEMERRKWSTFLQRPKCPKPASRYIEEPTKSTYRVVIRTKKDLEAAKVAAEEAAIKEAEDAARAIEEAARALEEAARAEEEAARAAEEAERIAFEEAEARLLAEYEMEQRELDENDNVFESEDKDEDDERSRSEATSKHMSGKEAVVTVEQQLAQVKEQLLALSELPTTIQMTLSVITEQLQKLAQEAQPLTEDDIRDDELSNADTETEDEVTELLVLESQEALSVVDEESENIRGDSTFEEDVMEEEIIDTTKEGEEAEARRLEEERVAKKEKEKMQRQPLTPLERPIILPGGRKWAQPDDAVRSVRQPKLSDDKIDETISSYYEVITGKTIGINFLKYQPPPKNLDHLQKSEVYKMVHDLEPPPRGITARAEKIPAVQDYLVKTNGEVNKPLPAQMER